MSKLFINSKKFNVVLLFVSIIILILLSVSIANEKITITKIISFLHSAIIIFYFGYIFITDKQYNKVNNTICFALLTLSVFLFLAKVTQTFSNAYDPLMIVSMFEVELFMILQIFLIFSKKCKNFRIKTIDYRFRYAAEYLTEDGHHVRSIPEEIISNFLFDNEIRYIYELELKINNKTYYPDFALVDLQFNNRPILIEYIGSSKINERTNKKNIEKIQLFKNNGYYVISCKESNYNKITSELISKLKYCTNNFDIKLYNEKIEENKNFIKISKSDFSKKEEKIKTLEKTCLLYKKEITTLKEECTKIYLLNKQNTESSSMIASQSKEIEKLKKIISNNSYNFNNNQKIISDYKKEIEFLKNTNNTLKKENETLTTKIESLSKNENEEHERLLQEAQKRAEYYKAKKELENKFKIDNNL